MDQCLKVFVSGVCPHPDNAADRMHICGLVQGHPDPHIHKCACGKEWCEITREHVCTVKG